MNINKIAEEGLKGYQDVVKTRIPITNPSILILYFGDLPGYEDSKNKIIMVGLNPSHNEFPEQDIPPV